MSKHLKKYGFKIGDLIQSNRTLVVYEIVGEQKRNFISLKVVDISKCKNKNFYGLLNKVHSFHIDILNRFKKCEKPRPTWEI